MTIKLINVNDQVYLGGHFDMIWQRMLKVVEQDIGYPYSLLIYGKSGVGKTTLGKSFAKAMNHGTVDKQGHPIFPALYVKITPLKSPLQLLSQILWNLGVTSIPGRPEVHALMKRLKDLLKAHQVKVIIIDEMQNALPFTAGQKLLDISKTLTELLDDSHVPLILLGTPALKKLLEIDKRSRDFLHEEQIARRFRAPIEIPYFPRRSRAWIEAINFLTAKKGIAPISEDDLPIIYRLHMATRGHLALLQKLLNLSNLTSEITSEAALLALKKAYDEGFERKDNPFDLEVIKARDLAQSIRREA